MIAIAIATVLQCCLQACCAATGCCCGIGVILNCIGLFLTVGGLVLTIVLLYNQYKN
jgi:hypothetical protein